MYEKRPVIENKLLSGRQVLASEPTPSDTSDSDSEYPEYYDHGQQRFLFEHRENLSNLDIYVLRNVSSDCSAAMNVPPHLILLLDIH